jgi:hypothetical protein
MLSTWVHTFAHDDKVHVALLLVLVDFVFGISAALKRGTFRLAYIADLAKTDILGKLLPYFALYVFALVAGQTNGIVIPGIDFGVIADAFYALIVAAWVGSILSSLQTLGIPIPLPSMLKRPEKQGP